MTFKLRQEFPPSHSHERRPEQVIQLLWRHLEESFNFISSASTSCPSPPLWGTRPVGQRSLHFLNRAQQGSWGEAPMRLVDNPSLPMAEAAAGIQQQWLRPGPILCTTVITEYTHNTHHSAHYHCKPKHATASSACACWLLWHLSAILTKELLLQAMCSDYSLSIADNWGKRTKTWPILWGFPIICWT